MNITNEEQLKIASTYLPCSGEYDRDGDIETVYFNGVDIETDMVWGRDKSDNWNEYHIGSCKFLLKDLSHISDEDAIEIAKILCNSYGGYSDKALNVERDMDKVKVWTGGYGVCLIWETGSIEWRDAENDNTQTPKAILSGYDYLRSKSYNIGYGKYSAQDLIDAGIVKPLKTELCENKS